MNVLEFGNLQSAWAGVNEFLFTEYDQVINTGGGQYGPEWVSYDNMVIIKRAWVDPDFDFGTILGYNIRKWSALVNNYVDFKYLDMIRSEVSYRSSRRARSYNYSYHFDNSHGSGKDCLIALNFMKRIGVEQPTIVFMVRTSEVTKRLLFDFLLVQRIVEYIYGHNDVEVHFYAPSFYITIESFCMYHNYRPIRTLIKGEPNHIQQKILNKFDFFMDYPNPEDIKYRVHKRVVKQIQKDSDGKSISGVKPMLVKDLKLRPDRIKYPEEVISKSQRKVYRKTIKDK